MENRPYGDVDGSQKTDEGAIMIFQTTERRALDQDGRKSHEPE